MDKKVKKLKIKNEAELHKWFIKNYTKLGYEKIIRKDIGKFPDFIMLRDGKKVLVELETLSSNFLLHKHDPKKVDDIVCIKNNMPKNKINVPIKEIPELFFDSPTRRISATVDPKTIKEIEMLLKKGRFRNKSHVIEDAIKALKEAENEKK